MYTTLYFQIQKEKAPLPTILRFGDPRLESINNPVDLYEQHLDKNIRRLNEALNLFQNHYNWVRSIAAPQIGIMQHFIVINTPNLLKLLINPEISWHSEETQIVWDDCISLPEIAVEVERWKSVDVRYQTHVGEVEVLNKLSPEDSELLQHEIDHLDGILMTQRMTDRKREISKGFLLVTFLLSQASKAVNF